MTHQVVHNLACCGAIDMAVQAFTSLERCCADRELHFVVHDDGTLRDADRERLGRALRGLTVIGRAEADDRVAPRLARYPRCREFRDRNPLALKLLDVPLLATEDSVACVDTDVLAFHPFAGVFDWPDRDTTGIFMQDSQNAYAVRPWHLVATGVALPMHVNTGLLLFRRSHHDLDFIEWLLTREYDVFHRLPGWLEQTGWAALALRGRCRLYDASQVRVVRDAGCLSDPALLIGHFTSNVRALWPHTRPAAAATAVRVRTNPAQRLTPARLAAEQIHRLTNRGRTWVQRRLA